MELMAHPRVKTELPVDAEVVIDAQASQADTPHGSGGRADAPSRSRSRSRVQRAMFRPPRGFSSKGSHRRADQDPFCDELATLRREVTRLLMDTVRINIAVVRMFSESRRSHTVLHQ